MLLNELKDKEEFDPLFTKFIRDNISAKYVPYKEMSTGKKHKSSNKKNLSVDKIKEEFLIKDNSFNIFNFAYEQNVFYHENIRFIIFEEKDYTNLNIKSVLSADLEDFLGFKDGDLNPNDEIEMCIYDNIDFMPSKKIMIFVDCERFNGDHTPSGLAIYDIGSLIDYFGEDIIFKMAVINIIGENSFISSLSISLFSLIINNIQSISDDKKWIALIRNDTFSNDICEKLISLFMEKNNNTDLNEEEYKFIYSRILNKNPLLSEGYSSLTSAVEYFRSLTK